MKKLMSFGQPFRGRLIKYLVVLLLAQGLVAYGALIVFDSLPLELTKASVPHEVSFREAMKGTVYLIKKEIDDAGGDEKGVIGSLQPHFQYPLTLLPKHTSLSEDLAQQLHETGLAVEEDSYTFFTALPSGQLLQLGPVLEPDFLQPDPMALLLLLSLWTLLSAIIFLGLLYVALAPLWRDAFTIRNTAEALAQGSLDARAGGVNTWLFKPLAGVMNDMAFKIQKQVHNSRVMSHAISHELKTPLARLRFSLGLLDERRDSPEQYRQFVQEVNKDIEELESLINVSLDYFRMEQHKIVLHRTETSLLEWGEALCADVMPLKPDNFELHFSGLDTQAYFDNQIVGTAVKNLLLNAFKYASGRVSLAVSTDASGGVIIAVEDDGPGIPVEAQEEIFIPFSRLDNSRTRATGGYGLGLSYVKLIAEQHHGHISVSGSSLGGARFEFAVDSDPKSDGQVQA